MAVMVPRESWTDKSLDELKESVNQRFDAVNQRFDAVDQRFHAVDQRFDAVEKRLDRVESELRELRRMMFQGFVAQTTITVSCFVGIAGLVVL